MTRTSRFHSSLVIRSLLLSLSKRSVGRRAMTSSKEGYTDLGVSGVLCKAYSRLFTAACYDVAERQEPKSPNPGIVINNPGFGSYTHLHIPCSVEG